MPSTPSPMCRFSSRNSSCRYIGIKSTGDGLRICSDIPLVSLHFLPCPDPDLKRHNHPSYSLRANQARQVCQMGGELTCDPRVKKLLESAFRGDNADCSSAFFKGLNIAVTPGVGEVEKVAAGVGAASCRHVWKSVLAKEARSCPGRSA